MVESLSNLLHQFYNLGFSNLYVLLVAILKQEKDVVCTFGGRGKSQCSCKIKKLVQMLMIVIALCFTKGHIHL